MAMGTFHPFPWIWRTTVLTRQACFSRYWSSWCLTRKGEIACHITMPTFHDLVFITCITIIAKFHVLVFVAK